MEPSFYCSGCQQFHSQGKYGNNGWSDTWYCNACWNVWDEEHKNDWRGKEQHQPARSPITQDEHHDHEVVTGTLQEQEGARMQMLLEARQKAKAEEEYELQVEADKEAQWRAEEQEEEEEEEEKEEAGRLQAEADARQTSEKTPSQAELEAQQKVKEEEKALREVRPSITLVQLTSLLRSLNEEPIDKAMAADKEAQWRAEEEEEKEKAGRLQAEADARQTSEKTPSQAELEAQQKVKEEEKALREVRPSITLVQLTSLLRSLDEEPIDKKMALVEAALAKVTSVSPRGCEELSQRSLKGAPAEVEPELRALKGAPAQVQRVASAKEVKTPDVAIPSNEAKSREEMAANEAPNSEPRAKEVVSHKTTGTERDGIQAERSRSAAGPPPRVLAPWNEMKDSRKWYRASVLDSFSRQVGTTHRYVKWDHFEGKSMVLESDLRDISGCPLSGQQSVGSRPVVNIACLGDSMTFGGYPVHLRDGLDDLVKNGRLPSCHFQVRDFGWCATTASKQSEESYGKCPPFKEASQLGSQIDIAIFMFGTNDSKTYVWNEQRFENEYAALIKQVQNWSIQGKTFEVLLVAPPPMQHDGVFDMQRRVVNHMLPGILVRLASRLDVPFVDANVPMKRVLGKRSFFINDGVHLTEHGDRLLAGIIQLGVQKLLDNHPEFFAMKEKQKSQ